MRRYAKVRLKKVSIYAASRVLQLPIILQKMGEIMTEEFKKIIDEDIEKCKKEIESGNKDSRGRLTATLVAKYAKIVEGFDNGLHSTWYDDSGKYVFENTKIILEKLRLFKALDYKNVFSKLEPNISIHNTNTNNNEINIDISFEQAKKEIENMTALPNSEVEEILLKVDELEKIIRSSDRKAKKWENAKGIIKWIADKGVDVGIVLLPLLLQIK